jgi:O-antigen/teichoic acid export membrane protein
MGLLSGTLAARLLGPQGRGELAAIQTWPTVCAMLAPLGFAEALVYNTARESERAATYLTSATAFALLSSAAFIPVAFVAMPVLLRAQSASVISGARLYLVFVPTFILLGMPFHALRGRNQFGLLNLLRVALLGTWLATILWAWLLRQPHAAFVARTYVVAIACLAVAVWLIARHRLTGAFRVEPRTWPGFMRYGLPCVLSTLPQFLNLRLDQMLIAALLPPRELGLYVVAVAWSGAMTPVVNAVAGTLFPAVASQHNPDVRIRTFGRGCRLAAALAATAAVAIFVSTPLAITMLFGDSFSAAVAPALVLVPAGALAALNGVTEEGLRGLGHPSEAMLGELVGLTATITLLALLLPRFGIMGAAVASLIAYLSVGVTLLTQARRVTGASVTSLIVPRIVEISQTARRLRAIAREAFAYDAPGA